MKLTVNVTQAHIDEGQKCSCGQCPIALALYEQHPPAKDCYWSVCTVGTLLWRQLTTVTWKTIAKYSIPREARVFIRRFDVGNPVEPFTFEMEAEA